MIKIPLSYTPIDTPSLSDVLARYTHQHHSSIIRDFENEIGKVTGSPHVVALTSGTAAIHLALRAIGVGEGDEVCVSTFTYVGTVNPILYLGASPVFIDCESETWNMDPHLLEDAVKSRISQGRKPNAILIVHSYGMPAKMDEILAIGKHYNIPIIEDAAEAIGSTYKGRHMGVLGDIGILSFNNNKLLTTYGGGALLTSNQAAADKVLYWATQARQNKIYYDHLEVGFNYQMSCLNAAMGLLQIRQLPDLLANRRAFFDAYCNALKPAGFEFCAGEEAGYSNHWLSTTLLPMTSKPLLQGIQELIQQGIEVRPLWKPMHSQPVFSKFRSFQNGTSEALFNRGLCLPSGGTFNLEIVEQVTNGLHQLLT